MKPLLDRFGTTVEATMRASACELLEKATKQLDPADPTSPLARHTAALTTQHQALARQVEKHHGELAAKVDELVTSLRVQEARTSLGAGSAARDRRTLVDLARRHRGTTTLVRTPGAHAWPESTPWLRQEVEPAGDTDVIAQAVLRLLADGPGGPRRTNRRGR